MVGLHYLATFLIGKSRTLEKTTETVYCKCPANNCYWKLRKIIRKVPLLEVSFKYVAGHQPETLEREPDTGFFLL